MSATIPADFVYTIDELDKSPLALGRAHRVGLGDDPRVDPARSRASRGLVAFVALLAASAQGFSKFLAPFWMVFPFMCVCYLFGGLSHGVKNTLFRTLIHQRVAPARPARPSRLTTACGTAPS